MGEGGKLSTPRGRIAFADKAVTPIKQEQGEPSGLALVISALLLLFIDNEEKEEQADRERAVLPFARPQT